MEQTIEKINEVLTEIILSKGNNPNEIPIQTGTHLANDLGFTSLDLAQMIVELQEKFSYDPLSNGVLLSDISAVGDLYKIFHLGSIIHITNN
ncbi:MAG: acyl carrier protein [Bacteroidota bacterium]|nr:MAG: acyl carrier protein [Bacteroidota bacterium]